MKQTWRSFNESKHYQDNKFVNLSDTPALAPGASFKNILHDYRHRPASVAPPAPIPFVRTDLKALKSDTPTIVWFGHSSYLIHCKGVNILIDPVFSGHASPVPGMIKAFPGANEYSVADMPEIDYLLLSHNHYDHLDKKTLAGLKAKTKAVYVPLGVGKDVATFNNITEMDWWETNQLSSDITLTATPARHFSGRGLRRNTSLWTSYVLDLFGFRLFLGGDSGYDSHFKEIGTAFGPFDIALLECGQYNTLWPFIHMQPEETAQAAKDLNTKVLMPVHWAKFTLANHPWNEPPQRLLPAATQLGIKVTTPQIGEPVVINHSYPDKQWWLSVNA
jgi:L-ascorbate metabolism protein UlaG (beta-lactamase superfamily)